MARVRESLLLTVVWSSLLCSSMPAQTSRPIPPGVRQADQAEDKFEKNSVPPVYQQPHLDPERARQEASELASLAQSIPSDINSVVYGALPKALSEKLKKTEKLSKKLRSEINP